MGLDTPRESTVVVLWGGGTICGEWCRAFGDGLTFPYGGEHGELACGDDDLGDRPGNGDDGLGRGPSGRAQAPLRAAWRHRHVIQMGDAAAVGPALRRGHGAGEG